MLGQRPLTVAVVVDVFRGAAAARARAASGRLMGPWTSGPLTTLTVLAMFAAALFYAAWHDIYAGDHGGEQEAAAVIAILYAVLGLLLCARRWWIHGVLTIGAAALAIAWQFSLGPVPGWQENSAVGWVPLAGFLVSAVLLGRRTRQAPLGRR